MTATVEHSRPIDARVAVAMETPPETAEARPDVKRILIRVGCHLLVLVAFVALAVVLRRGYATSNAVFNPDEAELMAQGRAALRSPVPFTTWTTATTGPIWPLFLALLGALGLPLTLSFAHALSATLIGVMGYFGFALARRSLGIAMSGVLTLFWYLPLVLVLTGSIVDFATLSTEMLPSVLLLAAAVFTTDALSRRPWLYAVVGALCALAVGAKYQAAPLALAVLAIHLIRAGDLRGRVLVRRAVLWGAGALLPAALLGLSMLISSNVSTVAIGQVLDFLRSYSGVPLEHRLANFRTVVLRMHLVLLVLTVCWLGARSAGRVQICRAIAVLAGLATVCAGGTDSGHYLVFLYAALALAIGLPIKQDAQLIPFVRRPIVAVAVVAAAALVGWAVAFGPSLGSARRATQQAELSTLPWDRGVPDPRLAQACPAGSNVVVWGWASELYVNYRWNNAIPVLNVAMFTTGESNRRTGYEMVRDAILDKSTDCVVDAVGVPFFFFDPDSSLTKFYPDISSVLHEKYRPVGAVIDCEACTVYVRR